MYVSGTFKKVHSLCGGNYITYLNSRECFNTAIFKRHFEAWVIILELYY